MGRRRRRRKIDLYLSKGDRVPRNYFIIPNAIFEKDLSTEALVTLMYLLLHVFFTNRFSDKEIIRRTVVIHSKPDDFTSQPAGNAGE